MQVFNLLIWKLSFIFLRSRQPKISLILVQKPKSKTPNVIHCGIDFMVSRWMQHVLNFNLIPFANFSGPKLLGTMVPVGWILSSQKPFLKLNKNFYAGLCTPYFYPCAFTRWWTRFLLEKIFFFFRKWLGVATYFKGKTK